MIVSIYNPKVRASAWERASKFLSLAEEEGFRPLLLVSSAPEEMDEIYAELPEYAETLRRYLYFSDYKTLVTMNRSNGGVTYFSDGYLVRKWSVRGRPDKTELYEIYHGDDTETIIGSDAMGSLAFQGFILYVFAVMLLL